MSHSMRRRAAGSVSNTTRPLFTPEKKRRTYEPVRLFLKLQCAPPCDRNSDERVQGVVQRAGSGALGQLADTSIPRQLGRAIRLLLRFFSVVFFHHDFPRVDGYDDGSHAAFPVFSPKTIKRVNRLRSAKSISFGGVASQSRRTTPFRNSGNGLPQGCGLESLRSRYPPQDPLSDRFKFRAGTSPANARRKIFFVFGPTNSAGWHA